MKRNVIYIIVSILTLSMSATPYYYSAADTVATQQGILMNQPMDDEPFDSTFADTIAKDLVKKAEVETVAPLDAAKYILDRRYMAYGDHFTKKWHDHLFLQGGLGMEQLVPPTDDSGYNVFTTAHIGVGKQFNRYHSLRLTLNAAFGYHKATDHFTSRLGAKLDHLFSLSSYFNGYKPDRLLDFSAVFGIGYTHTNVTARKAEKNSFELHAGLQMRLFTGPQGYLNIEPYVGVAPDGGDMAVRGNSRRYDMFYGANVNYIYYIHNNLSKEARLRYVKARNTYVEKRVDRKVEKRVKVLVDSLNIDTLTAISKAKSERPHWEEKYNRDINPYLAADTVYRSWQQPYFIELSTGMAFLKGDGDISFGESMGYEQTLSVGKWLSSALGIRLSATTSTTTFDAQTTPEQANPYAPAYTRYINSTLIGLRAEAIINPFGLNPHYSWDSPYGLNIMLGGMLGWMFKDGITEAHPYQDDVSRAISCHTEGYTGGLQFWAKLTDGLRFFVEPRYMHNVYKVPYRSKSKVYSDDMFNINFGVTMMLKSKKYRRYEEPKPDYYAPGKIAVGGGLGIPLISKKTTYKGDGGFSWNASAYGIYRFNDLHSVRAAFELVSLSDNQMTLYKCTNSNASQYMRTGVWSRTFYLGLASLNYAANLTNMFSDRVNGRRWKIDLLVGPAMAMVFGESNELYSKEKVESGYSCAVREKVPTGVNLGLNGGLHISYAINDQISAFVSPNFYLFKEIGLPDMMARDYMVLETLNLGVEYNF